MRYGVSFVSSAPYWYSASVPTMMCTISYYGGLRYNGTRLYFQWVENRPSSFIQYRCGVREAAKFFLTFSDGIIKDYIPNSPSKGFAQQTVDAHDPKAYTMQTTTMTFLWVTHLQKKRGSGAIWWCHNIKILCPLRGWNPTVTSWFPFHQEPVTSS